MKIENEERKIESEVRSRILFVSTYYQVGSRFVVNNGVITW